MSAQITSSIPKTFSDHLRHDCRVSSVFNISFSTFWSVTKPEPGGTTAKSRLAPIFVYSRGWPEYTVICICCQFVPSETIGLYFALLGKLCITDSYLYHMHSSELFPTVVVRNSGVRLCSSSARVGGVVASYFVAGFVRAFVLKILRLKCNFNASCADFTFFSITEQRMGNSRAGRSRSLFRPPESHATWNPQP